MMKSVGVAQAELIVFASIMWRAAICPSASSICGVFWAGPIVQVATGAPL
jgi:hypothetical protein